jgi:UMF1 family MFS transporter
MAFAYTGSLASALFIFVSPAIYYLAPILVIVGVTSLGCSFVLLNAFLPLLVANHPSTASSSASDSDFELEALNPEGDGRLREQRSDPDQLARDLERSAHIQ